MAHVVKTWSVEHKRWETAKVCETFGEALELVFSIKREKDVATEIQQV